MEAKISVIVPVYNIVALLPRCIDSILSQSFHSFELLLIDDGSTDGSGILCDEYAHRDKRIRVLHKQNGGVSSARNHGLEYAKGEYIQFIDGDDYVEEFMLEQLYGRAIETDSDVIVVDFFRNEDYIKQYLSGTTGLNLLHDMFHGRVMGALWNKFIKRKLFVYRCDESLSYCEDFHLLTRILTHDKFKVCYLNQAFYHYEMHVGSLTNNISEVSIKRIEEYIRHMEVLLQRWPEFLPFLDNNQVYMRTIALKGKLYSWNEYLRQFPKKKTWDVVCNNQIPLSFKLRLVLLFSCFYPTWKLASNILSRKE